LDWVAELDVQFGAICEFEMSETGEGALKLRFGGVILAFLE